MTKFKISPDPEVIVTTHALDGTTGEDPRVFNWQASEITTHYTDLCTVRDGGRACHTCRSKDITANVIRRTMRRAGVVVSDGDMEGMIGAITALLQSDRALDHIMELADMVGLPPVPLYVPELTCRVMDCTLSEEKYQEAKSLLDHEMTVHVMERVGLYGKYVTLSPDGNKLNFDAEAIEKATRAKIDSEPGPLDLLAAMLIKTRTN